MRPDRWPFSTSSQKMVVALLRGVCSHLLGRFLPWGQARSPPSCGSYRSKAILGSNILSVFHVISPAWGRGKGLTLSINHFFFPPPICSVILSLLHTPLIFDHFISLFLCLSPSPCWFFLESLPSLLPASCRDSTQWPDSSSLAPLKKGKRGRKKKKGKNIPICPVPHLPLPGHYAFS